MLCVYCFEIKIGSRIENCIKRKLKFEVFDNTVVCKM